MKYDIQIDIPPARSVVPLNLKLDEETVREFKYVVSLHRISMTHVLNQMLREFVADYRDKNVPKQRSMF
jgi:hypothetical protein